MELMDYLKWRNDVSLRAAPFNEIDNVLRKLLRGISPKKTGRGWNPDTMGSRKKNALCPIGCCPLK